MNDLYFYLKWYIIGTAAGFAIGYGVGTWIL